MRSSRNRWFLRLVCSSLGLVTGYCSLVSAQTPSRIDHPLGSARNSAHERSVTRFGPDRKALSTSRRSDSEVTFEQAEAFAEKLEQATDAGDSEALLGLIDTTRLTERILAGFPQEVLEDKELRAELQDRLEAEASPILMPARFASEGKSYVFIRAVDRGDGWRALFRMRTAEGKFNYHEYILETNEGGEAIAVDIFLYLSGMNVTEMLRGDYYDTIFESIDSDETKLSESDQEYYRARPLLIQMREAMGKDDAVRYFELVDQLPESIANSVDVVRQRTVMSHRCTDDIDAVYQWSKARRYARDHFDDNPVIDLVESEWAMQVGRFAQALEHYERLSDHVGGDSCMIEQQIRTMIAAGQTEDAVKLAQRFLRQSPGPDGYYLALVAAAASNDQKWVSEILHMDSKKTGLKLEFLESDPSLESLRQMEIYQQWRREQGQFLQSVSA